MNWKPIAAAVTVLVVTSAHALLGGFGILVTKPTADDKANKGAFLIVQPIGCYGPGAMLTARAEGIENGVRRSIRLSLQPIPGKASASAGDAVLLKRQWSATGSWVLVFTAKKEGITSTSLVKLDRNGNVGMTSRSAVSWNKSIATPQGNTKLFPMSFDNSDEVVLMHRVAGNLSTAVEFLLKS